MPTHSINTLFEGTDRGISYTQIPRMEYNDHNDHQHCEFSQDVHRDEKEMTINNPDIPKDTRVIIL
jgi:hypothetical protein